jgi:putative colanic acid biosynthesis UDP-glucose lipid carrier transferase
MKGIFNNYLIAKVLLDFPILIIAHAIAYYNIIPDNQFVSIGAQITFIVSSVFSWYLAASISKLNTDRRFNKYTEEIVFITYTLLVFLIIQASNIFLFKLFIFYSSSFFAFYVITLYLLITTTKYIVRKYLHAFINKGRVFERVLVIGNAEYANHFQDVITKHIFYGYRCIGALHENPDGFMACPYLGKPNQLRDILNTQTLDEIIVALPNEKEKDINEIITICNQFDVKVRIIPDFHHFISNPMQFESIGLIPVISQQELPLDKWNNQLIKRVFDILFSITFFRVIGSWLFPTIAILIKLSSKGPVLYKQKRWGLNNARINVYKFRTMYHRVETVSKEGLFLQTEENDLRITPLGRFLRKNSFDEFPQFLNVLKGEMSVVGPRPHAIPHSLESLNFVSSYMLRHMIKPGITGWAQVNGYRGMTKNHFDMQNRVNYDLYYIRKWNFWLDCQIVLQTFINLISNKKNVR